MDRALRSFERLVVFALTAMMAIAILFSVIDLAWLLAEDILTPPLGRLEIRELLELFGLFLLVLIGVELLETIKMYLKQHVVRAEIVIEVALIAIARKVIILEAKETTPLTLLGIASLIVALAIAHYLRRRANGKPARAEDSP